jgi:hypothetical protein
MITFFRRIRKLDKKKFLFLYIILLILFFEWFYFHPALRYGGYNLVALLIFIPMSLFLERYSENKPNFKNKVYIILILAIAVFLIRNTGRIYNEYKAYNYNPIVNAYYKDFQQNFKISKSIEKINMCIDNPTDYKCENENIKSIRIFNSYMFYRKQ